MVVAPRLERTEPDMALRILPSRTVSRPNYRVFCLQVAFNKRLCVFDYHTAIISERVLGSDANTFFEGNRGCPLELVPEP